jgi:hypothetical protein
MTTSWSVVRAAAHLHRDRHHAGTDVRSRKLLVWSDLVALREAIHGELNPVAWQRLLDRIVTAIADGRPVWPIYAAAKREWRA